VAVFPLLEHALRVQSATAAATTVTITVTIARQERRFAFDKGATHHDLELDT
jgi:hypothetical protein